MHVYFSGIGGAGIGPLALIAKAAGYEVSGSDQKNSRYTEYMKSHGIADINIGQTEQQIASLHKTKPIDWLVYTSAIKEGHAELEFAKNAGIKTSKREGLLSEILNQKQLKLVAIAGTHGKTTTTAMAIWLFKQLGQPVSYSVGAKLSFGDMGTYTEGSQYFIYECDEFDRHFLAFKPFFSIISGVAYDHHEIYPTEEEYKQAFRQFLGQSQRAILWQEDIKNLALDEDDEKYTVESYDEPSLTKIKLAGLYNRRDAWLVVKAVSQISGARLEDLYDKINAFPGLSRRFEMIAPNLYSDYAHTPEKIKGVMSVAAEMAERASQKIVIIYEPLTNRRMHYTASAHHSVFDGASHIYWVPSFLAREDPSQPVLQPEQLIKSLSTELQAVAQAAVLDDKLKSSIQNHLADGDLVVALSGGGAGSLDEWLRKEFGA